MSDGTTQVKIPVRACPNCNQKEWFTDEMTDWTIATCQSCGEMCDIRFMSLADCPVPAPVREALADGHTLDELIRDFRKRWRTGGGGAAPIDEPCSKCGSDLMEWNIGSEHEMCFKCGNRRQISAARLAHTYATVFRRGSIIYNRHMAKGNGT